MSWLCLVQHSIGRPVSSIPVFEIAGGSYAGVVGVGVDFGGKAILNAGETRLKANEVGKQLFLHPLHLSWHVCLSWASVQGVGVVIAAALAIVTPANKKHVVCRSDKNTMTVN